MRQLLTIFAASLTLLLPALACEAPRPDEGTKASEAEETATSPAASESTVFSSVVAERFYPARAGELREVLAQHLAAASPPKLPEPLLGLLVPHAGYEYSGLSAAHGYKGLKGRGVRTVVVLAPSHRVRSSWAGLLDRDAYRTPLGDLPIARDLVARLQAMSPKIFRVDERLFTQEHSLEVQLPFVQTLLPGARLLPIVLGDRSPGLTRAVAEGLHELLGAREDVLVVASSDLSHFLPKAQAEAADEETLSLVQSLDADALYEGLSSRRAQLCGAGPAAVLMRLAKLRGLAAQRIFYNNSGDTTGDPRKVVGYGVVAFGGSAGAPRARAAAVTSEAAEGAAAEPPPYQLSPEERRLLLKLARDTVETWVREGRVHPFTPPKEGVIPQPGAAFVTLKKKGRLRGCIGHTQAYIPLWRCIQDVARSAATKDTRFSPARPAELAELDYEVSVLTPLQDLPRPEDVRVGTDGLMVHWRGRRGLLLPQVPGEFGWSREEFLSATCRKASLPLDCWTKGARFQRFQALVFSETD